MTKKQESKAQIKVTQTVSCIGRPDVQRQTLLGLGLRKIGNSRVLEDTPSIRGMVKKVGHLIRIETV
ncbi:MAG: 50S ribosomal protein L30 [Rickettsiaceae bacterium]|nr:50S ribosomal protein L30 [Rickettsiaceae bacterium]